MEATQLLKTEIPVESRDLMLRYQDPKVPDKVFNYAEVTEIILPTENDIMAAFSAYRMKYPTSIIEYPAFKRGADYVINKIKSQ